MAVAKVSLLWILRFIITVILASWICIWFLKPTSIWKRSWHVAEDKASTTFLGATGLNVLVFSFPVLLVAAVGYIYIHFYTKSERQRYRPALIVQSSNPAVVHSPVGILSYGEVVTAFVFIGFLLWTYYSNLSSDLKKLTPLKPLQLSRWQLRIMRIGVRLGSLSEACIAILLVPVLRRMSLFQILNVQFEASVRYHVWLGNVIMLFSLLHGVTIMSVWSSKKLVFQEMSKWQRTGRVNVAGLITLVIGIVIWITSSPPIRRKHFMLFYLTHHLYILFLLFFLFHAGDRHFFLILSGVLLFSLDKIFRIIRSCLATTIVSARLLPCRAIELTLPNHASIKYYPTSTIFIKIPCISKLQWHPFSIISSSNKDRQKLSVLIKCQGQWTNSLYNLIESKADIESAGSRKIPIFLEGTYGPSSFPYQRYDSLILVAGGSGITPFLSIVQDFASTPCSGNAHPTKINLIYVVKRFQDLSMLAPVSGILLNDSAELGFPKLKLFVTRENMSSKTVREMLLDLSQMKSIVLDESSTMHALLQSEGLFFKAATVAVSALVFIISIICLGHIFLRNGGKTSSDKTASWANDLLIICSLVIVLICITVIRLLSVRRPVTETSERSLTHAKTAELVVTKAGEGQEHTEITFGKRPNLLEVLSGLAKEAGESNTGVFVCGPESMQVSVASFCKQNFNKSNADNTTKHKCRFTFQSINFSL